MSILSLDPSSHATGWAIVPATGDLSPLYSGVLKVPKRWPAYLRVRAMAGCVARLASVHSRVFDRFVVEVPGNVQASRKRAEYSLPPAYAAAVGAILQVCWSLRPSRPVVTVDSSHWTRGSNAMGVRKSKRVLPMSALPGYDPGKDSGGDEADAIMLGAWYASRYGQDPVELCALHIPVASVGSDRLYAAHNLRTDQAGNVVPVNSKWSTPL